MITLTRDKLLERLKEKQAGQLFDMRDIELSDADLSGADLSEVDFSLSSFHRVRFDRADMHGCAVENALFDDCSFRGTDFRRANLKGAAMRYDDLSGADISGANLFSAVLEHADLSGIISDADTKFFRLYWSGEGRFPRVQEMLQQPARAAPHPGGRQTHLRHHEFLPLQQGQGTLHQELRLYGGVRRGLVPGGRQLRLPQGTVGGGAGLQRGPVDGLHHRHPLLADKRRGRRHTDMPPPLKVLHQPCDPRSSQPDKEPPRLRPPRSYPAVHP